MELLAPFTPVVEAAIAQMGIVTPVIQTENGYQWKFQRGSAEILLILRISETHKGNEPALVVASCVAQLPSTADQQFELAKMMLSYNHLFVAERFSVHKETGTVWLVSGRTAYDLQANEIIEMLDSLSYYADMLDDEIQEHFGNVTPNDDNGNSRR